MSVLVVAFLPGQFVTSPESKSTLTQRTHRTEQNKNGKIHYVWVMSYVPLCLFQLLSKRQVIHGTLGVGVDWALRFGQGTLEGRPTSSLSTGPHSKLHSCSRRGPLRERASRVRRTPQFCPPDTSVVSVGPPPLGTCPEVPTLPRPVFLVLPVSVGASRRRGRTRRGLSSFARGGHRDGGEGGKVDGKGEVKWRKLGWCWRVTLW